MSSTTKEDISPVLTSLLDPMFGIPTDVTFQLMGFKNSEEFEVSNPFLDSRVDKSDNKVGDEKQEEEYDMFNFGNIFLYKTGDKAPKKPKNML